MSNAIVIIAPNKESYLKYALPSVEHFAKKYGHYVEVVTQEAYHFPKKKYNYKIFEKFQVQKFTDKYDRILRLDADIIMSPNCPDLFDLFPEDKLWAVYEDVGSRQKDRLNQINIIQDQLGRVKWETGYINSGVILTSRVHKELYNVTEDYLIDVICRGLGKFKEQNLINWRIRKLGYEVGDMGFKYNHMSMTRTNLLDSYIMHAAGIQGTKEFQLRNLYRIWYGETIG